MIFFALFTASAWKERNFDITLQRTSGSPSSMQWFASASYYRTVLHVLQVLGMRVQVGPEFDARVSYK